MKRKTIYQVLMLALISFVWMGCDNDNDEDNTYTISANLNSAVEVPLPTVPSTATGTLTGTYNAETNVIDYDVTWTGLTATAVAAHFHGPAIPGEIAPPVVTFTLNNNGTSGNASGTFNLSDTQEQDLLGGKWYVNVHTPNNPPGEIRGQVSAVK